MDAVPESGRRSLQTSAPVVHHTLHATNRPVEFFSLQLERQFDGRPGLIMDQPYQRGEAWDEDQKRLFVKSLLLGVPIPAVILNNREEAGYRDALGNEDATFAVIDGKQRILAITDFLSGTLSVPASWFPPEQVEKTVATEDGPYVSFDGLTRVGRAKFHNRALPCSEGRFASLQEEAEIFALVNMAGTPMSEDDLRRAQIVAQGAGLR